MFGIQKHVAPDQPIAKGEDLPPAPKKKKKKKKNRKRVVQNQLPPQKKKPRKRVVLKPADVFVRKIDSKTG